MIKKILLLALLLTGMFAQAQERPVQICAHRGFWKSEAAEKAQNSVAALKAAQDNGFWGSEFDVHLTADSVVVVNHDPVFHLTSIQKNLYGTLLDKGTLCNGEILPQLEHYLEQGSQSRTMLVLELKKQYSREHAELLQDLCISALKERGLWDPSRVMFISFDYEACKRMASLAPGFTVQYLEADKDPQTVHADGISGIDYHHSAFRRHPEWVTQAHELGMSVNAWTVDNLADMQYLVELGVDCITTNNPLELRTLLSEREKRPE